MSEPLDITETGARLQGWLGQTVWLMVRAGHERPVLTVNGRLEHELKNVEIEEQMAAAFGEELRGSAFVFLIGSLRLYVTPENFGGAEASDHEVRIRLDGAEVRITDDAYTMIADEAADG